MTALSAMKKRGARRAVADLGKGIERAIVSACRAHEFSAGSYTADTLADAIALRNLMAILREYVADAFADEADGA
jgi:hypothetical protein